MNGGHGLCCRRGRMLEWRLTKMKTEKETPPAAPFVFLVKGAEI